MSKIKKSSVLVIAALLVLAGGTSPAFADRKERLRTEAIEIVVPTSFKSPKSGCSLVEFRYKWRFFQNHETILAWITIENKKGWMIGEIYLYPDITGGEGVAEMKICSTRWVGEPEIIDGKTVPGNAYQGSQKGNYVWNLDVTDFDNRKNMFQSRKKTLRLT